MRETCNLPPVSIVVPAYNAQKTIGECLKALLALDYPHKEVLVVNDGSTDETAKIINQFKDVKLINLRNGGAARATNVGIMNSKYDVVVSVDSDAILERDWLNKVIPEFRDERVAVVGGYPATANKSIWGRLMGYEVESRFERAEKELDHLYTMNTAYRKQALLHAGCFNEEMKVGYDNDMSYRLKKAGYKLVLLKNAVCRHYWRDDLRSYVKQQFDSAYYRMELVKNFKKVSDSISSPRMILQVPLTFFSLLLSYFYPLLLVLPLLAQLPLTARLLVKKKDPAVLLLPLLLYLRNLVWLTAVVKWVVDEALSRLPRLCRGFKPLIKSIQEGM